MSKSHISEIIARHDLKPGDTMRNVHGDVIAGSAVLNKYMVIYKDDNGYRLLSENPLLGDQSDQWISKETLTVLSAFALGDGAAPLGMAILWTSSEQFVAGIGTTPDAALKAIRTIPGVADKGLEHIDLIELQPADGGWTASVD